MSFADDIKASKDLFKQVVERRRLGKGDIAEFEEIKVRYGISGSGTVATIKALSELMGVSNRTIISWKQEGMPIEFDGSYDPVKVLAWRWQNAGGEEIDDETRAALKGWELEYRKYRALLAKTEYETTIRALIPRSEVEELLVERALGFKKSLLGRARRLGYLIAEKDAKSCQAILEADSRDILDTYSRPNTVIKSKIETGEESES